MNGQLGAAILGGDVEIRCGAGDRQPEGLIEIHGQALVRFVPFDALVDAAEGREVAMSRGSLAHGPLGGQLRVGDAGAPSVDVSEVVEHLPHRLDRSVDLTNDCELWQLGVLPL
jgi:hypothetical protein